MSQPMSIALGGLVDPVETWSPEHDAPDESFEYIDLSAIDPESKAIVGAREVPCAEAPSRAKQIVASGDVLVSTVRPNLNGVARVPSEMDGATASTGFCVLRPHPEKLDGAYLFHWVRSPRFIAEMVRRATGASYPAVSDRVVFDSRLPLPPFPEQRRIAEVLDRAEALRAKRRAALAQLDTLIQSIFLDIFGDPATNPKGWPDRTIADICEVRGGKRLPKGEEYSPTPTPYRYIRVTDLKSGVVDEFALVYLKPEVQAAIERYIVNTGDVIISIAGSIGLIAPVPPSLDGANLTENAAKLVPRRRGEYDAGFLATLLQTSFAQDQISSHVGQVTIGKLALFRIEKIHVPIPPFPLQRDFARRVAQVEKLRTIHRASLAGLDALFASLQHRAFRGEL